MEERELDIFDRIWARLLKIYDHRRERNQMLMAIS
jgi:hypothetical protein